MHIGKLKKAGIAIAVGIVAIATFLSNVNSTTELIGRAYGYFFGRDDVKLSVLRARLVPVRHRADIKTDMDNDAFVVLQLRNYSKTPLLLTSAKLSLFQDHDITTKGSSGGGSCMLSEDPNENDSPITIEPGQTKWVGVARALRFDGLLQTLSAKEFDDVIISYMAPHMPYLVAQSRYVELLNKRMAELYGAEASVKVTYKINLDEEISFTVPLADGKDIFSHKGRFQQDWFIANFKDPSVIPYLNLSSEECNLDKVMHFPGYNN
ncbi:hypothetical protein JHU04_002658 [Brenneria sp. 4F2]|nr:hypothetical protein [Brenneria bubanii]